jgi:spore maturation protein SpmB
VKEVLIMTNMIDVVNNVANALRESGPTHMDVDSYHVVMDMPGFSEEALIVAFSRLLDNKAQATVYVKMVDSYRVLWLRTFLAKHYYM